MRCAGPACRWVRIAPVSDRLQFTGERFVPECEREIWYEHMHRYVFARQFVAGLDVLDAACGEGYGAALLAAAAARVVGVDLSAKAVEHALARYAGAGQLEFRRADVSELPFEDASFDRVVSFETIEHLSTQREMLAEFRRVLRPEGVLILSSPDREVYSEALGTDNPHHVRELSRDELLELVQEQFPACHLLGQRLMFHSVIAGGGAEGRYRAERIDGDRLIDVEELAPRPVYHLALCAADEAHLPALDHDAWLFDDAGQSVYAHYNEEVRRHIAAGMLLAEREAELNRWKARAEAAEARLQHSRAGWRRWFGRD